MALDKATFETITPSRFTTFSFPNPQNPKSLLRVAVLDSPAPPAGPPRLAAMLVPSGREPDWLFSAHSGHLHLLLSAPPPRLSRLILAGALPGDVSLCRFARNDASFNPKDAELAASLRPLFLALSPRSCFERGLPEIPVLRYEDGVVSGAVLGVFGGSLVGEMLVEDVEIVENGKEREFRRRLRFKRMPNLIQTQVKIVGLGEAKVRPELGVLVQPYLAPMAASLRLIGGRVSEKIRSGDRPRALCLGVGGGALVMFLAAQLGLEAWGVEEDGEVLRVGREFFGLEDGECVKLFVGDAMEFLERVARGERDGFEFDVVMVDLDSRDLENGVCAPPLEFRRKHVLSNVRSVLADNGIVVVNVVSHSSAVYETIKSQFREVFDHLFEIGVGNEENFVLIASALPCASPSNISDCEDSFVAKLRMAISGEFMDSIKKI